jgi:rfaE bifunctional protein kinase chain/domain
MQFPQNIFESINALVVGDVMLDRYWFGSVNRISPEAPVPVLAVDRKELRAGGAANVANNISSLGAKATILSVVGDDGSGKDLLGLIEAAGISASFQLDKSIQTTEKLRMVAQNQQLLRADFEKKPSDEAMNACLQDYAKHLNQANVIVLSDYGKGVLQPVAKMIELANEAGIPVVVDPKGSDFSRYKGASLITPNMKEFVEVVGEIESEQQFEEKGFKLRDEFDLKALLVTRSEKGMSLFIGDQHIHSPAQAREVYDVSGAGDTVISTIALALVADLEQAERLQLANAAAGVVVGKVGTATVTMDEINTRLAQIYSS